MSNILIKSLENAAGEEASVIADKKKASILVDGAPKYIGEYSTQNRNRYHIKDLNGRLLIHIKSSGVIAPSIEFQMGEKSLAVMKAGGLLRKSPVLYMRGHEYYLPKPDPKNGHFKIENWSFRFTDNQEMLISKPDDGKNLAAMAIGYYLWTKKRDRSALEVH